MEIQQLYKEPDIVAALKYRRMAWAGHVWRSNSLVENGFKMETPGEKTTWQTETKVDRRGGKEFSRDWNTRW